MIMLSRCVIQDCFEKATVCEALHAYYWQISKRERSGHFQYLSVLSGNPYEKNQQKKKESNGANYSERHTWMYKCV